MKKTRVIGIGFHKTGTSTLSAILSKLGYSVLGSRVDLAKNLFAKDYESVFKITDSYDAYQDNPWPVLYKEFDKRYPNSKFILTLRDEDRWIKSSVNHFGTKNTEMRRWIYGIGHPEGNESIYLEKYRKHNQEVTQYFKGRGEDLLVVNWEKNDGWGKICNFLNVSIPDSPFPHANKGDYNKKERSKLKRAKSLIRRRLRRLSV
ncbi:MAG: hypothetical protein GY834_01575 [Bacteroidetes bacterium]|nr:hypothetical protein [Bacteroidota bacterium]